MTLLEELRNYLDITWEDELTDRKLEGILARGQEYLDGCAGRALDYTQENQPKALLFDYCRYARSGALEMFWHNFRAELLALRILGEVETVGDQDPGADGELC